MKPTKISFPLLTALLLIASTGCATMKAPQWSNPFTRTEPARMVAFWNPAVKPGANGTVERGFAGRVYFYDNHSSRPVRANGVVKIYAFGEDGRYPDDIVPDITYAFTQADLKAQYDRSPIGHSYIFWLPWDNGEDIQQEVNLIVRFLPESGNSAVFTQTQAPIRLPGRPNPRAIARDNWLHNHREEWLPESLRTPAPRNSVHNMIQQVGHSTADARARAAGGSPPVQPLELLPFSEHPVVGGDDTRPDRMQVRTIPVDPRR